MATKNTKKITVKGSKIDLKSNNASSGVKNSNGTITYTVKNTPTSSTQKSNTAALEQQLGGLVQTAKGLQKSGKTSSGLESNIARSESMLSQTKKEGNTPYKGSTAEASFKKDYPTYVEPTVISDTTIREEAIPDLKERINNYAETGQYYDNNGNLHNADGSVVDANGETGAYGTESAEADALLKSADEDMQGIFDTLDALTKQTDQNTASQIKSIKAQYDVLRQQQEEINRREQASEDTMLLLGGSSRYTSSAVGLSAGIQRAGIMELAALDAAEMSAISEAKAAQAEQNYKLAAEKIDLVEVLRKEKIDKATAISKAVAEENKKMRDKMIQMSRESAIATLFKGGVTDAASILDMINYDEEGNIVGDVTLKEIQDTLAIIDPAENLKGANADYQTYKMMQKAGEIPSGWSFFDYKTALTNASSKGTTTKEKDYFSGTEMHTLEGAGFTESEIADLPDAIKDFGIDAVLAELDGNKKEALDKIYSREDTTEFLTTDFIESLFTDEQLKNAADEAGYRGMMTDWEEEKANYLESLMGVIRAKRNAGYTDKEIFKEMQ